MPTPYGSRGGMAFGAQEIRVLRRALALALRSGTSSSEDVRDCLRLAEAVDEATREAARLRAFLVADLTRYRAALPGTAAGYLALLREALGAGYQPGVDDLAALRALRGNPAAAALLERCRSLTEEDVRTRLARALPAASRARLTALPGGLGAARPGDKPGGPAADPAADPAPTREPRPVRLPRPVPTPGEVFPPRRPVRPPSDRTRRRVAG
ncbi:hypothetical protein [Streptomyces minutiscleroticus]|nr:hypothetical protein [Streptomyces minutiscleroticus]